jgi:hypothetical protein
VFYLLTIAVGLLVSDLLAIWTAERFHKRMLAKVPSLVAGRVRRDA